tara:strand:- start:312 stop:857 length:546 start_codon:yes stop_codon:yes gene_type:complete
MSEIRVNKILPRDGLPTGASGGGIVQTVQSVVTSNVVGTTGQITPVSVMSADITPSSASNKILVLVDASVGSSNGYNTTLYLFRDNTKVYYGDASTNRPSVSKTATMYNVSASTYMQMPCQIMYLDSPATTSTVTYSLRLAAYASVAYSFNRSYANQADSNNAAFDGQNASSITLMEVSAP